MKHHPSKNPVRNRIKVWAGIGSFSFVAAAAAAQHPGSMPAGADADRVWLAQGGEGGEGGGGPSSYRLFSTDPLDHDYDAQPQLLNYARLVHASYEASAASAARVLEAINRLLEKPTDANMAAARSAWVQARTEYLVTETFRFYDGPIDLAADGSPGPESRINAWPLNEAFIDYVRGQPGAGIVNDPKIELSRETLMARDQVSDEADVTTGWHAIEFLLWGQDFNPDGPGSRPVSDYAAGPPANDRRRLYLRTAAEMLLDDLRGLAAAWAPDADNYRKRFLAADPRESLGRMFQGMANLAAHELAHERLSVALDSGDQEDEHSCFSDTTHQDHLHDLRGIRNVWVGSAGDEASPDGLRALVARIDPALAAETDAVLAQALAATVAMPQPFDSILRARPDSVPRQRAEEAVAAYQALGRQLVLVGRRIGVLVIVPGMGSAVG